MFPRRLRLSRRSFPDSRSGRRASSPHFSLVFGPSAGSGAAAVVSKKVARRSVDRHLLKRRMVAVMRPYTAPGRFLVIHARAGSEKLSFTELSRELSNLLQSALSHG